MLRSSAEMGGLLRALCMTRGDVFLFEMEWLNAPVRGKRAVSMEYSRPLFEHHHTSNSIKKNY